MALTYCLAGIDRATVPMLHAALNATGAPSTMLVARLDVAELKKVAPDLLICDIDELAIDPLEMLRRIRFVLPDCTIAVYTGIIEYRWGRACHLAGASCLLAKGSTPDILAIGIREALHSGCYTDPQFVAEPAPLTARTAIL